MPSMPTSSMEDHTRESVERLLTTFEPNTADKGMTPDPHSSFRRHPAPEILTVTGSAQDFVEQKSKLAWSWVATLFQLPEAKLYDGSEASAKVFADLTGIPPSKFAQGWLEAQWSVWRYFHPSTPGNGQAVTDALCDLWAEVSKFRWSCGVPGPGLRNTIIAKIGSEVYAHAGKLVEDELSKIMSIDGSNRETVTILKQLNVKGNFDCTAHPALPFCSCPVALDMPVIYEHRIKLQFIKWWDIYLINTDDAFLFNGDIASGTLFKVRYGKTPEQFAGTRSDDLPPFWEPAGTKQELVDAMLSYWVSELRDWKAACKTRKEVRTREHEDAKAAGEEYVIRKDLPGISVPADPHENDNEDPLCRYVKVPDPNTGHAHTLVLYAKYGKMYGRDFGYDILGLRTCHPWCEPMDRGDLNLPELVQKFLGEDLARAMAVKAEW